MKITNAIILVQIDNDKVHQLDISTEEVMNYITNYGLMHDSQLYIIEEPLYGVEFVKKVLNERSGIEP